MSFLSPLWRETFEAPCTVMLERSAETLEAHVIIDSDYEIRPGDEVLVRDPPTEIGFGEKKKVSCIAVITRASSRARFWTRVASNFELNELYDVSFSDRRKL